MNKYQELKQSLKDLAVSIRKAKAAYKQCQRDHGCEGYWDGDPRNGGKWINFGSTLRNLKKEYRHKHIAYSLIRGVPRDLIEHPAENNQPDENLIREILQEYENVHTCA